jgi:hypothetical protein
VSHLPWWYHSSDRNGGDTGRDPPAVNLTPQALDTMTAPRTNKALEPNPRLGSPLGAKQRFRLAVYAQTWVSSGSRLGIIWLLLAIAFLPGCCWKEHPITRRAPLRLITRAKAEEIALGGKRRTLAGSSEISGSSLTWKAYWRITYTWTHSGVPDLPPLFLPGIGSKTAAVQLASQLLKVERTGASDCAVASAEFLEGWVWQVVVCAVPDVPEGCTSVDIFATNGELLRLITEM